GLATLVLAFPLFLALPRTDIPLFPVVRASRPGVASIGDRVRPRAFGPQADGEETVANVSPETLVARDRDPYFRVAAYEVLEGAATWLRSGKDQNDTVEAVECALGTVDIPGVPAGDEAARYEFVAEADVSSELPVPDGVSQLRFRDPVPDSVDVDGSGALRPRIRRAVSRWSYSATAPSAPVPRRENALARGNWHARCLFLPTGLRDELRQAVAERTRGATTDREKVTALADWIRS